MEATEKVIERVRKLLALGGSSNEAEAKSAIEKAHGLLRDYNLCIEDVKEKPEIGKEIIEEGGRETKWKSFLLIRIAEANYCAFITGKAYGGAYYYKLYGREGNVKSATLMYEYLIEVVRRETKAAGERFSRLNKNEFAQGMALRLGSRLKEMAIRENTECTALVPVLTEAARAAEEDAHPRHVDISVESTASRSAGYMAGADVSLTRQLAKEAV